MKPSLNRTSKYGLSLALICLALLWAKHNWNPANLGSAENSAKAAEKPQPAAAPAETTKTNVLAAATNTVTASTNAPVAATANAGTNAVAAPVDGGSTNAIASAAKPPAAAGGVLGAPAPGAPPKGTANVAGTATGTNATALAAGTNTTASAAGTNTTAKVDGDADGVTLSFQGAPIDMVVQWLAKTTEKSVIKHPRVQCQLTIVSSKKLPAREAINLVYRALGMEGFTVVETKQSIFLVPEGQEPKLNPEIVDGTHADLPEGRQRIVKFFPLKHIQPAELREKVRGVLSEKGTIEADERANQLIATDYTDNIRLLVELVKEFDVEAVADSTIEIISLAHTEAEELSSLLSLVINAQPGTPASSSRSGGGGGPRSMGGDNPGIPSPSGGGGAAPQNAGLTVKIWPDKASNRLIVAAPKSKLPEVRRLVAQLDTDKPRDVTLRVIPLKNVSAEDLAREIQPLYQKPNSQGGKDDIQITANSRSNALIIYSSEANYQSILKLISTLDTEEAQEKTMQAFALKNADAEDVAKQLQDLNQDQDSMSRYFYYYSSSSRNNNSKKLSVVADRRRNTVIVQGPPASMEKVAKMIETLDQPVTDNSLAPKIYPLKFVSASDLEDVLNELFLKKQQQRTYWYYDDGPSETADRNVGRLYGKVRITSEPFSNSLIVTANSAEHLAAVEDVIKKLDAPSESGDTTLRVNLQFAKSVNVANSINILFAKAGSPPLRQNNQQPNQNNDQRNQTQQQAASQSAFGLEQEIKEEVYYPWLGGQQDNSYYRGSSSDSKSASRPVSDLVGRVRVVPDNRGNGLMVTCNVHFFPQIMKMVNELDAPTPQVLISARILEISSDFRDKLGVRWSPATGSAAQFTGDDFENSFIVNNSGTYSKTFAGSALADALTKGVLNSKIDLDILVQFLRKNTDATVLAEPRINIADNEMGKLFVGAQVPFLTGSLNTDVGGRNDSYSYKDVGVILEVTPRINNAEEMALKIRAESSTLRNGETINGGVVIDTRNFRTELMLTNGQTAVLGGIINRQQQNIVRKIPVLGSIPGLGWLFKKKDKTTTDVELMVFLSPKITRTPEQAKKLVEDEEKATPKVKQYNEQERAAKDLINSGKIPAKTPDK